MSHLKAPCVMTGYLIIFLKPCAQDCFPIGGPTTPVAGLQYLHSPLHAAFGLQKQLQQVSPSPGSSGMA